MFCVKCLDTVAMVDFRGEEKKGDVILTGSCASAARKWCEW